MVEFKIQLKEKKPERFEIRHGKVIRIKEGISTSKPQLVKIFEEPSDSDPNLSYTVSLYESPEHGRYLICECPAFIRGKQQKGLPLWHRNCKHCDRVRAKMNSPLGVYRI